jgi:hypothetical protein
MIGCAARRVTLPSLDETTVLPPAAAMSVWDSCWHVAIPDAAAMNRLVIAAGENDMGVRGMVLF